jgi:hypothetical protein
MIIKAQLRLKGDFVGHPFRGNQYTTGERKPWGIVHKAMRKVKLGRGKIRRAFTFLKKLGQTDVLGYAWTEINKALIHAGASTEEIMEVFDAMHYTLALAETVVQAEKPKAYLTTHVNRKMRVALKGDYLGHPFRGNQWIDRSHTRQEEAAIVEKPESDIPWEEFNKAGPTRVFHGTPGDAIISIAQDGLHKGRTCFDRPRSVYFTGNKEDAIAWGTFASSSDDFTLVEFEIPDYMDKEVFTDTIGNRDFNWTSAFRVSRDIPGKHIKSITIYERTHNPKEAKVITSFTREELDKVKNEVRNYNVARANLRVYIYSKIESAKKAMHPEPAQPEPMLVTDLLTGEQTWYTDKEIGKTYYTVVGIEK